MGVSVIASIPESHLGIIVLSILVLLLAALIGAKIVEQMNIPKVAGEIFGGIVVGPSVLGYFFPEIYAYIFCNFPGQGQVIFVFYWLGLIMLMFSSGYETTLEDFNDDKRIIGWLAAGATIPPIVFGYYISQEYFVHHYLGIAGNTIVFNIIFAIAVAVTSLPVISKIFMDLGLIKHRYAKIILTTAAIQDLFLWVILSVASSILTTSQIDFSNIAMHVLITVVMFVFAIVAIPQLCKNKFVKYCNIFSYDSMYFIVCFFCVYIGWLWGVNVMYSALVAGMIFKNLKSEHAAKAISRAKGMSSAFFTPVYFAIVGLRIHVTADFSFSRFALYFMIASVLELAGCIIAMRMIRLKWLTSFNLGVAMNARGGPGIVLASVTYEMGIINYEFFCVMIFTSLLSSALAGWWIDFINKRGKLLDVSL